MRGKEMVAEEIDRIIETVAEMNRLVLGLFSFYTNAGAGTCRKKERKKKKKNRNLPCPARVG
jgi:hypothetical protein